MIEVNVNTESGTIQVSLPQDSYLEIVDTWNNRRLLMVLLRLFTGANGKPLRTFAEIAKAFGYADRRNVNNFWREFEQSRMDFLQYLKRKYKIDERVRDCIAGVFLEDLFASTEEITEEVGRRLQLGKKGLSEGTVRNVLGDLLKVQAKVNKMLEQGTAHVREKFLIEELFALVDEASKGSPDKKEWVEKKVEHLEEKVGRIRACEEKGVAQRDNALEREMTKKEGVVAAWAQEYALMFLLYWNGVSLSKLGQWFSVDKSTVWRRVTKFSAMGFLALGLGAGVCSGVIGVDEKWIKIEGTWHYLFTAVDLETGMPLHFEIYKSRSAHYCRLFMTKLRQLDYTPRVIVTDGWIGYVSAIKKVFPNAQHQLCIFHVMRAIMDWLKEHIGNEDLVAEYGKKVKRIFQTRDKRTARRRYKKLKKRRKIKGLLRLIRCKWSRILPAIGSTWIPTTNNGTERWNRAFERFYRARQAFGNRASAYDQGWLFLLGYLIDQQVGSGLCPLERINPAIRDWALYKLWNKPDFSKLYLRQAQSGREAA